MKRVICPRPSCYATDYVGYKCGPCEWIGSCAKASPIKATPGSGRLVEDDRMSARPWNLYRVQDADRSAFVVARSYQDAIDRWKGTLVAAGLSLDEIDDPGGVEFLTDYIELVLPNEVTS